MSDTWPTSLSIDPIVSLVYQSVGDQYDLMGKSGVQSPWGTGVEGDKGGWGGSVLSRNKK